MSRIIINSFYIHTILFKLCFKIFFFFFPFHCFPEEFIDASLQGIARAFWAANSFFISPLIEGRSTIASTWTAACA